VKATTDAAGEVGASGDCPDTRANVALVAPFVVDPAVPFLVITEDGWALPVFVSVTEHDAPTGRSENARDPPSRRVKSATLRTVRPSRVQVAEKW